MKRGPAASRAALFGLVACLGLPALRVEAREPRWASRQWAWVAAASFEQATYRTFFGDELLRDYWQRRLRLTLGVHGFVLSPNLAQFRLEADTYWDAFRQEGASDSGTLRFGGRLAARILPMGPAPVTVFLSRERFSLTGEDRGAALLLGVPESWTGWGARVRFRNTVLRGGEVGYEDNRYDYADPATPSSSDRRASASWTGSIGPIRGRVAADLRLRDYPGAGFRQDDQTALAEARGALGRGWQWAMNADAYRRTFRYAGTDPSTGLSATWSTSASRAVARRDRLEVVYRGNHSEGDGAETFDAHLLDAKYVRRITESLSVYPFALFGYQTGGDTRLSTPQLGVGANFVRLFTRFDVSANGQASCAWLSGTRASEEVRDTRLAYGLSASAGQGRGRAFSQRAEVGFSRNELRTAGRQEGLPDLGVGSAAPGTQDRLRTRLTLGWSKDGFQASAVGEWQLVTSDADAFSPGQRLETWSSWLQAGDARVQLTVNAGDTRSVRPVTERARYGSAYLSWNVLSVLSLTGYGSLDRTETPDRQTLDVRTVSAGIGLSFVLDVRAWAYRTESEAPGGVPRKDEGLVVTVGRSFGGGLPIFAGGSRRGVIR